MAAVYIYHLPFFSTPHLYTVSPGSWEGMGAEITWIMNNYYLKAKKENTFCSVQDMSKNRTVSTRNQKYIYSSNLTAAWCNVYGTDGIWDGSGKSCFHYINRNIGELISVNKKQIH